eukprot:COSAG02_NODE_808_length_16924_cov_117.299733_11_plen_78_part_00
MVTMSSFGKFKSGSNTELFQEIRTIHASFLHSGIPVRIPDKPINPSILGLSVGGESRGVSGLSKVQAPKTSRRVCTC